MHLSKRMRSIVDICPECGVMADIGSDHGLMPIALILEGKTKKAIASDISEKSLQKAARNIQKYKMEDRIVLRTGDGLNIIKPHEVQVVLISGLGGQVIADMIMNRREIIEDDMRLLLSPNQAVASLRETLAKNSFETIDEDLVQENNKFYPILLIKKGQPKEYSMLEYEFGKLTIEKKHPLLKAYLAKRLQDALKMEKTAGGADNKEANAAREQAELRLEEYRRLFEWL